MVDLLIMRHGKSDWDDAAGSDHERPLASRGEASARVMGELIRNAGLVPDLVISSTAVRARTTAEIARIAGGWTSRFRLADQLYGASVDDTLSVIAEESTGCSRVMIVGHQPTWSMVVHYLTGARVAMRTCSTAVIELDGASYDTMDRSSGTLVALYQPRHFLDR